MSERFLQEIPDSYDDFLSPHFSKLDTDHRPKND